MKNILIITLGTREIQFKENILSQNGFIIDKQLLKHSLDPDIAIPITINENYEGYVFPKYPRLAGQTMFEKLSIFKPVIEFPLIDNAIKNITQKHSIDKIILVYTNQENLNLANYQNKNNYDRDTIYYARILREIFKGIESNVNNNEDFDIEITEKTTDIDFQYQEFAKKCKSLFNEKESIERIFLLPQGGIDQINHALTLQLIQEFRTKVILWQQAEGTEPHELRFPFLFIDDLNKQKILKHIEDYDFGFIDKSIAKDKIIIHLSKYCDSRLQLKHDTVITNLNFLKDKIDKDLFNLLKEKIINLNDLTRIQDLYIAAKIDLLHEKYGEFIWKLFTISENIFEIFLESMLEIKINCRFNPNYSRNDKNPEWIRILSEIDTRLPDYLKKKKILLNNPSRRSFYFIFCFLHKGDHKVHENVFLKLEDLSKDRNKLAHEMKPIKKETLYNYFSEKYSLKSFISDLDALLEVNNYGDFDKVKKFLLDQIG